MCAQEARPAAISFSDDAKLQVGEHQFPIDAQNPWSQPFLDGIAKIKGLDIRAPIVKIIVFRDVFKVPPGIHQIVVNASDGKECSFWVREGKKAVSESSFLRTLPSVDGEQPAAKAFCLAEKIVGLHLFDKGKAHLEASRKRCALETVPVGKTDLGEINKVCKKWIIPLSDILCVLRNGLGLVMILLILTGTSPVSAAVLTLAAVFSLSLILQGSLFAFPQGVFGWGTDSASRFMIVRSLSDVKHSWGMGLKTACGVLSLVEGLLWIALGLSGLVPAMAGAGVILTFILFNVFFTGTFVIMTGMAIRDLLRHQKFRNKLEAILKNEEDFPSEKYRYQRALEFLRDKTILKSLKPKHIAYSEEEQLIKKAARKIYRMQEQLEENIVADIGNVDDIIARMHSGETGVAEQALGEAKALVAKARRASDINLAYDKWTIRLGIIGAIVGGLVYNILHAVGLELIGQAADFASWMPLNMGFLILDVDWVVPALVDGKFKTTAREKLVDPVVAKFYALGAWLSKLAAAKSIASKLSRITCPLSPIVSTLTYPQLQDQIKRDLTRTPYYLNGRVYGPCGDDDTDKDAFIADLEKAMTEAEISKHEERTAFLQRCMQGTGADAMMAFNMMDMGGILDIRTRITLTKDVQLVQTRYALNRILPPANNDLYPIMLPVIMTSTVDFKKQTVSYEKSPFFPSGPELLDQKTEHHLVIPVGSSLVPESIAPSARVMATIASDIMTDVNRCKYFFNGRQLKHCSEREKEAFIYYMRNVMRVAATGVSREEDQCKFLDCCHQGIMVPAMNAFRTKEHCLFVKPLVKPHDKEKDPLEIHITLTEKIQQIAAKLKIRRSILTADGTGDPLEGSTPVTLYTLLDFGKNQATHTLIEE